METIWDVLGRMADLVPFHSESDRLAAHAIINDASLSPADRAAAKAVADADQRAKLEAELAALDAPPPEPLVPVADEPTPDPTQP